MIRSNRQCNTMTFSIREVLPVAGSVRGPVETTHNLSQRKACTRCLRGRANERTNDHLENRVIPGAGQSRSRPVSPVLFGVI